MKKFLVLLLMAILLLIALALPALADTAYCPTCQTNVTTKKSYDAVYHYTKCATCGTEITKEVHDEVQGPYHEKTCTSLGYIEFNCACGYSDVRYDLMGGLAAHTPVTDAAQPATCTTKGKTEGSHCSVCQTVIVAQQDVAMLPHTEVIDAAVPATCTTKGKTQGSHCSVCKQVIVAQQDTDPAHTPEVIPAVAGTCIKKGMSEGSRCSVCKQILVEPVETEYGDHTIVIDEAVPATCTKGKTQGSHCSVCKQVIVAQQDTEPVHTPEVIPAVEGTCIQKGMSEGSRCSLCQTILVEPVETEYGDHNVVIDKAVSATCAKTGKTKGSHCSLCGKTIKKQQTISKKEHKQVTAKEKAPTCTMPGRKERVYCPTCGTTFSGGEEIAALGHKWVLSADGSVSKCSRCTANCSHEQVDENNVCLVCKMTVPAKEASEETSEEAPKEEKKVAIVDINALLENMPELVLPKDNEEATEEEAKAYLVKDADANILMLNSIYSEESNLVVGMDEEKMDALVLPLSEENNSRMTIVPSAPAQNIGLNVVTDKDGKPGIQIETDGKTNELGNLVAEDDTITMTTTDGAEIEIVQEGQECVVDENSEESGDTLTISENEDGTMRVALENSKEEEEQEEEEQEEQQQEEQEEEEQEEEEQEEQQQEEQEEEEQEEEEQEEQQQDSRPVVITFSKVQISSQSNENNEEESIEINEAPEEENDSPEIIENNNQETIQIIEFKEEETAENYMGEIKNDGEQEKKNIEFLTETAHECNYKTTFSSFWRGKKVCTICGDEKSW